MTDRQRSPEWFEARKNRLTASSVGGVLGCAPYMSRDDVMRQMVRSYHGAEREFKGNVATDYGTQMEGGARWQYEMEHDENTKDAFFDIYEDWLGASTDAYVGNDGLLEIKCPYSKKIKPIADQPHYYAQIQVQLLCSNRKWCHFYTWTLTDTNLETVTIDQGWRDYNMPLLRQFYAEYLHEREHNAAEHLEPIRKEINTVEACQLIAEYDEVCEQFDRAQERKKEIMARFFEISGGKNALIDGKLFTKIEKKGSISYAAVVKKHCKGVDLEPYRGKSSEYYKLT